MGYYSRYKLSIIDKPDFVLVVNLNRLFDDNLVVPEVREG